MLPLDFTNFAGVLNYVENSLKPLNWKSGQ